MLYDDDALILLDPIVLHGCRDAGMAASFSEISEAQQTSQ
jgi:hypothetical protein